MKVFIVLALACVAASRDYDIDCDNVNPEAKKFVEEGIPSNLVFMISKTTCPYCTRAKQTLFKDIGESLELSTFHPYVFSFKFKKFSIWYRILARSFRLQVCVAKIRLVL